MAAKIAAVTFLFYFQICRFFVDLFCDLHLFFSMSNIPNVNILKYGESRRKTAQYGFYWIWYSPSIGAIEKVVLRDLDHFVQVFIFQMLKSWEWWELGAKIHNMTCMFWYFPTNSAIAKNCIPLRLSTLSGANLQISTMLFLQICLHL